jgi:CheY-like chemotaxis protein
LQEFDPLEFPVSGSASMAKRILIAGPDSQKLSPYALALSNSGHEARTATTGLGCLESVRSWHPNLLIMNPDPTWGAGFGVLGVLYEDIRIPNMPIVLLADDAVRIRAEMLLLEKAVRKRVEPRPDWSCFLHRQPITPAELCRIAEEVLFKPHIVHEGKFAETLPIKSQCPN